MLLPADVFNFSTPGRFFLSGRCSVNGKEYFTPHRQVGGFGSPETTTARWLSLFDDFLPALLPRDANDETPHDDWPLLPLPSLIR